jgi:heavy metal sensor kinase
MKIPASSVRLRLTIWYTLALALIVLAFSLAVFLFVKDRLFRQFDRGMAKEFAAFAIEVAEDAGSFSDIESQGAPSLFEVFQGGALVFRSASFRKAGLPEPSGVPAAGIRTERSRDGGRFRLLAGPVKSDRFLVVAQDEESVWNTLQTLLAILYLALPAALLLAALGGYVLAGRLLAPVGAMARQAAKIGAESLSERLSVANPDDEFGKLAAVFNQTLTRLQNAFERLQRFTADASHELRTPLTALQSVGEVALQENLDAAAYRDRIGSMLEETSRLTNLVESLLVLTRADSGRFQVNRKPTDIGALVGKAVEDMRVLAEERNQKLTADLASGIQIPVDGDLLRQAMVNILDNAIKFTPPGGTIAVVVEDRPGVVGIEVRDSGPGIPADHQDKIFDRFYRVEKDRPRDAGGVGLGLAIAKWAVEANGGRIELESREGQGSTFRIVLPK